MELLYFVGAWVLGALGIAAWVSYLAGQEGKDPDVAWGVVLIWPLAALTAVFLLSAAAVGNGVTRGFNRLGRKSRPNPSIGDET